MPAKTFHDITSKYGLTVGLDEAAPPENWAARLKDELAAKQVQLQGPIAPQLRNLLNKQILELQEALQVVLLEVRRMAQGQLLEKLRQAIQDEHKRMFEHLMEKNRATLPGADEAQYENWLRIQDLAGTKWPAPAHPSGAEAAEKARQEAEAKRLAEEKAKAEADAKARQAANLKAEEKGRQEAAAKRLAEEKAKAEADAKARQAARLKAEAEEKARAEADAKARQAARLKAEAEEKGSPPLEIERHRHGRTTELGKTLIGLRPKQRVFSRFVLQRPLGQGGMGVVWLARDETVDLDVALKFVPEAVGMDPNAVDELKKETRRSLTLTHPNIVRIYSFFSDKDMAAISMEFVDGRTLAQLRSEKEHKIFQPSELERWLGPLCDALDYAHLKAKVVHRDIKPANLMVSTTGELKITDFGIARSLSDSVTRVTMTMRGAGTSGTLLYMSPQQLSGLASKPTDDIYSVGATLYELLTSRPPFYTGEVAHQIRDIEAPLINERLEELGIESRVPKVVQDTVAACLKKNPLDRPQNARELGERLGVLEVKPPSSRSGLPRIKPPEKKKGHPLALALGIVAGLGLLAGGAYHFWPKSSNLATPQPTNAAAVVTPEPTNTPVVATPEPANVPVVAIPAPTNIPVVVTNPPARTNLAVMNPQPTTNVAVTNPPKTNTPPVVLYPQAGHPWTNSVGMRFAPLPGTPVLLSIWETRVSDYKRFVTNAGYDEDKRWARDFANVESNPVVNVSYDDAFNFCRWLTTNEQGKGALKPGQRYRLPTDREWSLAVGLGDEKEDSPKKLNEAVRDVYPWGTNWPPPSKAGNFCGQESGLDDREITDFRDDFPQVAPVGSFSPTANGFYDVTGNIWEWCSDAFDPPNPERVVRGGAWDTFDRHDLLSSHRGSQRSTYKEWNLGFRCVLDTAPAAK